MKLIAAVISGLLLSSPALPQSAPGTTGTPGSVLEQTGGLLTGQAGATTTATDPDMVDSARRICRQVPTSSGSRMATRRLCMTADGWRNWQRTH